MCVLALRGHPSSKALIGDAKQAMSEGKGGPVEAIPTGLVATALCLFSAFPNDSFFYK